MLYYFVTNLLLATTIWSENDTRMTLRKPNTQQLKEKNNPST